MSKRRFGRKDPFARIAARSNASPRCRAKALALALYKCYQCRKPFTVRMKTIFESSHIALHLWLQAIHLLCASKKGISSNQLHRTLGITLKTAWFLRIASARPCAMALSRPWAAVVGLWKLTKPISVGKIEGAPKIHAAAAPSATFVLTVVERGGSARSFHVDGLHRRLEADHSCQHRPRGRDDDRSSRLVSGDWRSVRQPRHCEPRERRIRPLRRRQVITTNTVEGYYSIFKRGMKGVYQHCDESTFTAIWPNSTSATPIASSSALTTLNALTAHC